jgi:RimJ/RimL family protein N-acetyltransferase
MDKVYPQRVTLKGGTTVTLRPLQSGDEAALARFFSGLPPEHTEFLKDNVRDAATVQRFLRERENNNIWVILALADDGRVVADASLHTDHHGWRRHIGEVRVVVDPQLHKQRLATTLIHELVNQASIRGLKKLEAQILATQVGARTAFEHLGFREEARLKDHALDHHGRPHDLLILTNTVEDLWRKMEDLIADLEFHPDAY